MPTRRRFLSAGLIGLTCKAERRIEGSFVNESAAFGHALRDGKLVSSVKHRLRVPVVIVGGGIAGLSAAWHLNRRGFHDFVLLEMEAQAGGNARWGENEISRYPWAAHYVPIPDQRAVLVRELMEELGALQDGIWNERYLCFTPQERLFVHGRWEEQIEPVQYAGREWKRFEEKIAEYRASGAFTIPMELGARPSPLDLISMQAWLEQNGFTSPYLRWYVDYACRDDYGLRSSLTSAWAGIYYFAARASEDKGPLTWPEGNGWITRKLLDRLKRYVRSGQPVVRISRMGRKLRVLTLDTEYLADAVIFAAPTFLASRLVEGANRVGFTYSSWITANLTLDRLPDDTEMAWDNVIYHSPSLGYVNATHMSVSSRQERTVLTWYHAPGDRRLLLEKDWHYWKEFILQDLARAHPTIRECVSRIDVMRMGHAMASPVPGAIFSTERLRLCSPSGNVVYANSDLSGFSVFEEAQYRGVKAAESMLKWI